MNTGSSLFKNTWGLIAATTIAALAATTALAEPKNLDILGLVPGVSELGQVKQAGVGSVRDSSEAVRFEIGGHKILCVTSYLNEKLAKLFCPTGKGTKSHEQYTEASNTEVHSTLKTGFTNKFGEPDTVRKMPVRTGMGVEYQQELVAWVDERGNRLLLISRVNTVNMGLVTFESLEYLKEEAEKNAAAEARKKF